MVVQHPLRARQQLAGYGELPVAIGYERVFAARRRTQPFGDPEHEHRIDIETRSEAGGSEENAIAESADAIGDLVEFGVDCFDELDEARVGPHGVEATKTTEHVTDALQGLDLAVWPTVALVQQRS
jgi:hypothetical protein